MTEPRRYSEKPAEVEAMKLTRENVEAAASWCGGTVIRVTNPADPSDEYVALDYPTLKGVQRAQTADDSGRYAHGDVLTRGANGDFTAMSPSAFYDRFNADPSELDPPPGSGEFPPPLFTD